MASSAAAPLILVTVSDAQASPDPARQRRKIGWYLEAVARAGGEPIALAPSAGGAERSASMGSMAGLLLSGGTDLDPALYGQAVAGSREISTARDAMELEAFAAARSRGLPVLGICRGLQAINVFCGGALVQHVEAHESPEPGAGEPRRHPLRVAGGSRLGAILGQPTGAELLVNSFHHQAVVAGGLARGLVASAWADGPDGELVEGLEGSDERFLVAVQCHPERVASTPPAFERLFAALIESAARRPAGLGRRGPQGRTRSLSTGSSGS